MSESTIVLKKKKLNKESGLFKENVVYTLLCLPGAVGLIFFHWIPMGGIVLAFKTYNFRDGVFGSLWCGLDNFKYLFKSNDLILMLRNTIGYNLAHLLLSNILFGAILALFLYEVKSKWANKFFQLSTLLPYYVPWVVISYVATALFDYNKGIINQVVNSFGGESINFYTEPSYWPFILIFFRVWKDVGMAAIYLYSVILAIDPSLFEAAAIDGAGKFKTMWHVELPALKQMIATILVLHLGGVLASGIEPNYLFTNGRVELKSTTYNLGIYQYMALISGPAQIGSGAAVGIFTSFVGCTLTLSVNWLVGKLSPESQVF